MFEFNPDGSIKLPSKLKALSDEKSHFQMKIEKEITSSVSPKACNLHLTVKGIDNRFVESIYKGWKEISQVDSKIIKIDETQFIISIGTCFSRCTDCTNLIYRYNEFLKGNISINNSTCTFKGRQYQKFTNEDYFD